MENPTPEIPKVAQKTCGSELKPYIGENVYSQITQLLQRKDFKNQALYKGKKLLQIDKNSYKNI